MLYKKNYIDCNYCLTNVFVVSYLQRLIVFNYITESMFNYCNYCVSKSNFYILALGDVTGVCKKSCLVFCSSPSVKRPISVWNGWGGVSHKNNCHWGHWGLWKNLSENLKWFGLKKTLGRISWTNRNPINISCNVLNTHYLLLLYLPFQRHF